MGTGLLLFADEQGADQFSIAVIDRQRHLPGLVEFVGNDSEFRFLFRCGRRFLRRHYFLTVGA